jgi:putative zinc finger/helix-turn-helix YgiT family protein
LDDSIKCDVCGKGKFRRKKVARHDVSSLVGLEGVALIGAPALVCSSCGAVMLEGGALDEATEALTLMLVEQGDPLTAGEVRYLRRVLEMTQAELAERIGLHRTTVARWEIGEVPIGQAESMALRALVAMQLVAERPNLAKEPAAKFARPGVARATPPYEIKLGAAG